VSSFLFTHTGKEIYSQISWIEARGNFQNIKTGLRPYINAQFKAS